LTESIARGSEAAAALVQLVRAQGAEIGSDPRRVEAFLADLVPGAVGAIAALTAACSAGIPGEISAAPVYSSFLETRLVKRLVQERCLAENAAEYSVRSWAAALQCLPDGSIQAAAAADSGSADTRVEAQPIRPSDARLPGQPTRRSKPAPDVPSRTVKDTHPAVTYRPSEVDESGRALRRARWVLILSMLVGALAFVVILTAQCSSGSSTTSTDQSVQDTQPSSADPGQAALETVQGWNQVEQAELLDAQAVAALIARVDKSFGSGSDAMKKLDPLAQDSSVYWIHAVLKPGSPQGTDEWFGLRGNDAGNWDVVVDFASGGSGDSLSGSFFAN